MSFLRGAPLPLIPRGDFAVFRIGAGRGTEATDAVEETSGSVVKGEEDSVGEGPEDACGRLYCISILATKTQKREYLSRFVILGESRIVLDHFEGLRSNHSRG